MGSSKKHKKHKSERRERYEEYSNSVEPHHSQHQRGLKLILKMGSNSTPEHSADSGPPTAAEAMMSAAPSSPVLPKNSDEYRERHKKSKKKKKKKDRNKKHKHHKERKHRIHNSHHYNSSEKHRDVIYTENRDDVQTNCDTTAPVVFAQHRSPKSMLPDNDSSQDEFSFMDDQNSQPLPENILFYAGITTDNSPSCRPVSKQIVPRKVNETLLNSPASSSGQSLLLGLTGGSPTKPLPELLIPSPSTPGGSLTGLTPKGLEAPKTPNSSDSGREPRTCVLKLKQQKSPLNKMLDHLLRFLEKRDPHQFFAWPVTDDIAPGYSSIINKPMDFSTMRQKIEDNEYASLIEFTEDFKRMCENAIRYNHVDTVYHKAAKRLLQVGLKHLMSENILRSLKPLSGYMRELTAKELGFDLSDYNFDMQGIGDSADEGTSTSADEPTPAQLEEEAKRRKLRLENDPKTRFEPYLDDLTSEEILSQVQGAAKNVKTKLSLKEKAHKMGFLRQHKDGTTSLKVLIRDENEGPERIVNIGELVGKLKTGTGQLHTPCEDKRNDVKLVKTLNYGAFASFAPTFDSRFSNLSKEETQLVLRTYGDTTSTEYAESILQFTNDSNYASKLANGLLDILTKGEHSNAMTELYDLQVQNYEQQEVLKCFNHNNARNLLIKDECGTETREQIEEEYEKYKNIRIDFSRLRSLSDLGIDISFLDTVEAEMKTMELNRRLQEHLNNNLNLIEKLRATQHERLSQPLPQHLSQVPQPGSEEIQLAQQITLQLSDVAKKLPPSVIADPYSLRKAMGISYTGLPPPPVPIQRLAIPEILQQPLNEPQLQLPSLISTQNSNNTNNLTNITIVQNETENSNINSMVDIDEVGSSSGVDLEHELREFLESGTSLHASANADDSNIVAQLLMN